MGKCYREHAGKRVFQWRNDGKMECFCEKNDGKMMGKCILYGELEVVQLEIRSGDFDILVATNVAPKA
jgi:hypothetical protein